MKAELPRLFPKRTGQQLTLKVGCNPSCVRYEHNKDVVEINDWPIKSLCVLELSSVAEFHSIGSNRRTPDEPCPNPTKSLRYAAPVHVELALLVCVFAPMISRFFVLLTVHPLIAWLFSLQSASEEAALSS